MYISGHLAEFIAVRTCTCNVWEDARVSQAGFLVQHPCSLGAELQLVIAIVCVCVCMWVCVCSSLHPKPWPDYGWPSRHAVLLGICCTVYVWADSLVPSLHCQLLFFCMQKKSWQWRLGTRQLWAEAYERRSCAPGMGGLYQALGIREEADGSETILSTTVIKPYHSHLKYFRRRTLYWTCDDYCRGLPPPSMHACTEHHLEAIQIQIAEIRGALKCSGELQEGDAGPLN